MPWPVPFTRPATEPKMAAPTGPPLDDQVHELREGLERERNNHNRTRAELARVREELARTRAEVNRKHAPISQAPVAPICSTECKADTTQGQCVIAHLRTQRGEGFGPYELRNH